MIATPYNKLAPRYVEQGVYFAHHGYAYVAYDKRGRYDSDGEVSRYGPKDGEDLNAMQDWAGARSRGRAARWDAGRVGLGPGAMARRALPQPAPGGHDSGSGAGRPFLQHVSGRRLPALERRQRAVRLLGRADQHAARGDRGLGQVVPLPPAEGPAGLHRHQELAHMALGSGAPAAARTPGPASASIPRRGMSGPASTTASAFPTFNLTGWYDQTLTSVIASFLNMQRNGPPELRESHKLMIGPWTHSALFQTGQGQLVYPAQAAPNGLEWRLRWFDRHLKGIDNGLDREPPVYIYVMGADQWRNECEWPLKRTRYVELLPAQLRRGEYVAWRRRAFGGRPPAGSAGPLHLRSRTTRSRRWAATWPCSRRAWGRTTSGRSNCATTCWCTAPRRWPKTWR